MAWDDAVRVMLRVFAPAEGPADARRVAKQLRAALAAWLPVESRPPQQYWKVPQWYEHTIELSPPSVATFDAVVALAASGWTHVERDLEFDSVWNRGNASHFLLPDVVWAQLQRLHRTRAHVLYLRSNQIALSREPVGDWRELQERHEDYMASLGPWTIEEILSHFSTQFGGDAERWPLSLEEIERFMNEGPELVLRSRRRE